MGCLTVLPGNEFSSAEMKVLVTTTTEIRSRSSLDSQFYINFIDNLHKQQFFSYLTLITIKLQRLAFGK